MELFKYRIIYNLLMTSGFLFDEIAVRFHPKMTNSQKLDVIADLSRASSYITITEDCSESFFECGVTYYDILFLNPYATGLMEITQGFGKHFVLFHDEMRMALPYERYLRANCENVFDVGRGFEVFMIKRTLFAESYGASYLYQRKLVNALKKRLEYEKRGIKRLD
ncbi:hypothetical protein T35B1_06455 [Salinisphaera shabanensis T35B1]